MKRFVSHNDIGINYVERGRMRVLLATGDRYWLEPAQFSVYWGAIPHKVEHYDEGSLVHYVALPLGLFLQWRSLALLADAMLRGRVFIEPDAPPQRDLLMLKGWARDLRGGDAETRAIVQLEMEARLRRLARNCLRGGGRRGAIPARRLEAAPGVGAHADRMLLIIAEHFEDSKLAINDVAEAVGLNPDYAARVFRRWVGLGMTEYIAECRVSHAKALLATSDTSVLDVAIAAGFGSSSQFHVVFKRICGCTPRAYRRSLRRPA